MRIRKDRTVLACFLIVLCATAAHAGYVRKPAREPETNGWWEVACNIAPWATPWCTPLPPDPPKVAPPKPAPKPTTPPVDTP